VVIVLAVARPDLVAGLVVIEPNLEPEDATLGWTIADQTEEAHTRFHWGAHERRPRKHQ